MSETFRRDTFDRICDNLCEVLLSYETFTDRFRHQSVSKQFQRLVYTTQKDIEFDGRLMRRMTARNQSGEEYIDANRVAIIMKKCANIERIDCSYIFDRIKQFFEAIHKFRVYCPKLKELYLSIDDSAHEECISYVFSMFGQIITRFDGNYFRDNQYLPLCPNLSNLIVNQLDGVFDSENQLLVKNLKTFKFAIDLPFNASLFDTFIAANQSLKRLHFAIYLVPESQDLVIQVITQLTRFSDLIELHITSYCDQILMYSLYNKFTNIGIKCVSLKKLSLYLRSNHPSLNDEIMDSFRHFRRLSRLVLHLSVKSDGNTDFREWDSFKSMSRWPQTISHLTLSLSPMCSKLIAKLHTILPALLYLEIWDPFVHQNGVCLDQYSSLLLLHTLIIVDTLQSDPHISVNLSDVIELLRKCPKLSQIGGNISIKC